MNQTALKFSAQIRTENIHKLQHEPFDILVIGGGITGAGIARDAALRGYKTALIEKSDFASGTSSKSSKLVHGGFRYLKSLEFGLVHEALLERKTLMEIAPHLVHPVQCLLPIYTTDADPSWMIHLGLLMYDLLSTRKSIGRHRMISKGDVELVEPMLRKENLRQIAQYYDCRTDDFRLTLATIQSAAQNGAVIANYVRAVGLIRDGDKSIGIEAENVITGERFPIGSRVIANASGPWCDQLRTALEGEIKPYIRPTKGVHLIISREHLPLNHPVVTPSVRDRRPIFFIPWRNFIVMGTTDTDYDGDPDRLVVERSDVEYLLDSTNHIFPNAHLTTAHIISTYAGLRPLANEEGKSASAVTREYQIIESPANFYSIFGGKLTTYRTMALEMVNRLGLDLTIRFGLSDHRISTTDQFALYGGEIKDFSQFFEDWQTILARQYRLGEDVAENLIETYGSRLMDVLEYVQDTPEGDRRILPNLPYVWAELAYALEHEMAMTLNDFMIRRTHLFSLDSAKALPVAKAIAERMADYLEWSDEECQAQIARYAANIKAVDYYKNG